MRRSTVVVLMAVLACAPSGAQAFPPDPRNVFVHAANSPAGHAAFDVPADVTAGAEEWAVTGMDVVPFYYEQGMASGPDGLVFSSRASLTGTSTGCPRWDDVAGDGCYAVRGDNPAAIPPELVARGFDHVGGIDIGAAGPASGLVFAPLETDPPRSVRAYGVYRADASLDRVGLLVEEVTHRYNSWVAVDPSGRFMIAAEDRWDPLRVYEIGTGSPVTLTRRPDLDVVGGDPEAFANYQGCKFDGPTTLYCANWKKRSSYFDVASEVYRISLSAPVGQPGATATSALAFSFTLRPPAAQVTANVPYGLETEDLAFWGGELHVQVRGEALGWVRVVHLARG